MAMETSVRDTRDVIIVEKACPIIKKIISYKYYVYLFQINLELT